MMSWEVAALAFGLFYFIIFCFENFRLLGGPPGPISFPPFGNLIQVLLQHQHSHIALHKLSKVYGDVMSIKLGLMDTVLISSSEAVKQIYVKEEALGRGCWGVFWDRVLKKNIGLGFSQGAVWAEARAFCRESLRKYGYGNRETMKNLFLDELAELFQRIEQEAKSNKDNRVHFDSDYFHPVFMNLTAAVMMGKRFNYSDIEFQTLLKDENAVMKNGMMGAGMMMAFPFLRFLFPETLGYNLQMKGLRGFYTAAVNHLRERRRVGDYVSNPSCFTDDFLKKMDEDKVQRMYTEDHYALLYTDILQAGTDTTSNVVNFVVLHLIASQTIQEKVYREILDVIGTGRSPDIEDKLSMPYTQAVIWEGLRWSRVALFGVPRCALEDFTYRNYKIKKGTVMMSNAHSIFFDEEFWVDPNVFRPERFLDVAGNPDTKKIDRIIAFGAGKRNCFGEVLARDSMFIFITTLIQKYKFEQSPGAKMDLEPVVGISLYTHPYEAIITLRNH